MLELSGGNAEEENGFEEIGSMPSAASSKDSVDVRCDVAALVAGRLTGQLGKATLCGEEELAVLVPFKWSVRQVIEIASKASLPKGIGCRGVYSW